MVALNRNPPASSAAFPPHIFTSPPRLMCHLGGGAFTNPMIAGVVSLSHHSLACLGLMSSACCTATGLELLPPGGPFGDALSCALSVTP